MSAVFSVGMKTALERGEHKGCGPEWACDEFGVGYHDYLTCSACTTRFESYLAAKASLSELGLLARRA